MANHQPSSGLPLASSSTRKQYPQYHDNQKDKLTNLDRLPTISASEALRKLRDTGSRTIPTGLDELDRKLVGEAISSYGRGGLVRGQLTEVFGPPGCGKTAFA
jgi:RecA/RadA recombinase